MGIGLVFGVMRLVNFAHGELITAGAYALLLTNDLPVAVRIVVLLRDRDRLLARHGVRLPAAAHAPPATMLVDDVRGQLPAAEHRAARLRRAGRERELPPQAQPGRRDRRPADPLGDARVDRRRRAAADRDRAVPLTARPRPQMRAAASTSGRRASSACARERSSRSRSCSAGFWPRRDACSLVVQRPLVTPNYGFQLVIPALVGVVVGGMDRLVTATLGGFALGFATSVLADRSPGQPRVFLDVLHLRPRDRRPARAPERALRPPAPAWSACEPARPRPSASCPRPCS